MRCLSIALAAIVTGCASASSSTAAPLGAWGSSQGSLTVADTTAQLLLANGSCYIVSGDISGAIRIGQFSLPGIYTQRTGYAPGHVQYPATFSGTADPSVISISILVPGLGTTLGPVSIAYGVTKSLTPCLLP